MEYAEGQIRRLLSGQVELWELPLTGGLWRVTGAQVAQAAAAEGAPGPAAAAVSEEEVRGPHASLAVRLQVCHASGQLTVHVLLEDIHAGCRDAYSGCARYSSLYCQG